MNGVVGRCVLQVWVEEGVVLSGWSDGFLRAYGAASGAKAWVVPNAHRRAGRATGHRQAGVWS